MEGVSPLIAAATRPRSENETNSATGARKSGAVLCAGLSCWWRWVYGMRRLGGRGGWARLEPLGWAFLGRVA